MFDWTAWTEGLYLAVRLRLLQVTRLCCLVAADLVIDRWGGGEAVGLGGGQELYCRGNQAGLVPHGQQGIMVLLPQAPRERGCCVSVVLDLLFPLFDLQGIVLTPDRLFAVGRADGKTERTRSGLVIHVGLNTGTESLFLTLKCSGRKPQYL